MTSDPADTAFMRRALQMAERGWGRVQPNPLVGAVVVQNRHIVGSGFHDVYGGPHAEIAALAAAGEQARGATLYVSLEPCSHHGKTPPCTDAIIAAGIRRVVYAGKDPNPVAAGGHAALENAGIAVTSGVMADAARRVNGIFYHTHEHTTPFVALKLALSLDGRIAAQAGAATRITGPAADAEVHRMRAGYDAIMVGVGTLLADDPLLTVRGAVTPLAPPARVVLDATLATPADCRLLRTAGEAPVIILTSEAADTGKAAAISAAGALVVRVPAGAAGALDLDACTAALWEQGIRSVLCEGGSRLATSLIGADAVHRATFFYAPVFLGIPGVPTFASDVAMPLHPDLWGTPQVKTFGRDVALTFDRQPRTPAGN